MNKINSLVNQLVNENNRLRYRIDDILQNIPKNDLPCIYQINEKCVKTQEKCEFENKNDCKWAR